MKLRTTLHVLIVVTLSLQYVLSGMFSMSLAESIVPDNPYISLIGASNNVALFLFPVCNLLFVSFTTFFMMKGFGVDSISLKDLFGCTSMSFVFPLIEMIVYNAGLYSSNIAVSSLNDINNIRLFDYFTIKDCSLIGKEFWGLSYFYILFYLFYRRKVNFWISIFSIVLPLTLVQFLNYICR